MQPTCTVMDLYAYKSLCIIAKEFTLRLLPPLYHMTACGAHKDDYEINTKRMSLYIYWYSAAKLEVNTFLSTVPAFRI